MRRVWLALMVAAVAAAGCTSEPAGDARSDPASGPTSSDAPSSGPIVVPPPETTPTEPGEVGTGAIRGSVVDDEARPVPNAAVGIASVGLETRTSEAGAFFFDRLPPNTYVVVAQRIGYFEANKNVEVPAGGVVEARLVLAPRPVIAGPYYFTQQKEGYLGCSLVTPVLTSDQDYCKDPNHKTTNSFNVSADMTASKTEAVWKHTSAIQATELSLHVYWEAKNGASWTGKAANQTAGPSPLPFTYNWYRNVTLDHRVRTTVYPRATSLENPTVLAYQQPFTVYFTAFYLYPRVPEGFTAVPT